MNKRDLFNRSDMTYYPLRERYSKVDIEAASVDPDAEFDIPADLHKRISIIADSIIEAKKKGASVICAFGAHTIKNGLGRILGEFVREGWISHLATNGAGVIHDWEFSYLGRSSEDVRENLQQGKFGTWEETGFFINLALAVGSFNGLGYGESIGAMISDDGLLIPDRTSLIKAIQGWTDNEPESLYKSAAATDLLELTETLKIKPGFMEISHRFKQYSAQCIAYDNNIPFTSHPMFGHDIIYTHKANRGAVIGRTAELDFLTYVGSISNLEGGVYLSIGSAVMSPMIFEKALSMARNVAFQHNSEISDVDIYVIDLQKETWDWSRGEPPMDNPAYYLRFMKTFNRAGCREQYISADNRLFLLDLYQELKKRTKK